MPDLGLSAVPHQDDEPRLRLHAQVIDLLSLLMRAPLDGIDDAIGHTLRQLGGLCGVERTFVFRRRPADAAAVGLRFEHTHGWCAPGVLPAFPLHQDLPGPLTGAWLGRLEADQAIDMPDAALLPEESADRAHLQLHGVRARLVVPMRAEGRLSGCVGFDALRTPGGVPTDTVRLVKSVADAIGTVLARADTAAEIARTQASLAEANGRMMATLRALPDLILELDSEGRYIDVHTADPGQMLVQPEELIGKTSDESVPPEIAALNRRAMTEVDVRGHSTPAPFWVDTARGRRRYVLTASRRPPLRPGEAPGYVFVARDVTEEWNLQREAERLSLIARRMTDLVLVIGLDNRIEWVNPAFEARAGWSLDEVRGRRPAEFLHSPGTDRAEVSRLVREMAAGRAVRGELLNQTRSGEEFWTAIDIQPLHDATGSLTGFVSIETDVTARKAQAAALERLAAEATQARARLESAVEALPDAFVYFDADDHLVLSNERYRALAPILEEGGLPGGPLFDTPADDDSPGEPQGMKADADERQIADGRWLRMIERRTPEGGRVAMGIDITAVKEAKRRLVDIIEGAEAGTWEWYVPEGTNLVNDRWAQMVGYRLDELAPLTIEVWRSLVHPDDLADAEAKLARVFARETDQFEYQLRMRHKAGHWVWIMSRGRVARWSPDGGPELMAGVHIDVTALKRAEQRLAQIIDAATAGTWEFDYRAGQQQINNHWAEMLGYDLEDLRTQPELGFRALVHPDDMARLDAMYSTLLEGETHFTNEIRMRHRDGRWVWILSRGQVVDYDAKGKPLRAAGIHLDINDRKQLEAQLTAERDYLARLMDTSTSGIAALDSLGRIIFANREAERILGLGAEAMDGRAHDAPEWQIRALDGGPMPVEDLPFSRVMATGETVRNVRVAIAWPDGTQRMISVNAAPIAAEGLAVRVVCSIADISEQVAAEGELRAAAVRAEAANQAKSRFLANMSHEIRTPLNGVLGMAQVLEDELSEPRHRRILGIIRESGELLLSVLNDILDMSKIEAGKLTLEDVPFDLSVLAARIEALHRPNAESKGLSFDLRLGGTATGVRRGDPNRLSQVLHNLIGNAVKFTQTGSVRVVMEGTAEGQLQIVVRDTGIGMTEAQLARVFEDFEQADGTVTRRFGGTGLGMSIVRRLVDLMGGEIAIDSVPGSGTEVRLRLPLPFASASQPVAPAPPAHSGTFAGLRVLAADDNVTNRLILKSMLARLQIDAVLVADGRAAVEAWAPGRFDILLLDIMMPELDGMSALAEIRALEAAEAAPPAPALAITANALSHQVTAYVEAGFTAHLGKPFRREDLAAALAAALAAMPAPDAKG